MYKIFKTNKPQQICLNKFTTIINNKFYKSHTMFNELYLRQLSVDRIILNNSFRTVVILYFLFIHKEPSLRMTLCIL